jgi:hypothetical protein
MPPGAMHPACTMPGGPYGDMDGGNTVPVLGGYGGSDVVRPANPAAVLGMAGAGLPQHDPFGLTQALHHGQGGSGVGMLRPLLSAHHSHGALGGDLPPAALGGAPLDCGAPLDYGQATRLGTKRSGGPADDGWGRQALAADPRGSGQGPLKARLSKDGAPRHGLAELAGAASLAQLAGSSPRQPQADTPALRSRLSGQGQTGALQAGFRPLPGTLLMHMQEERQRRAETVQQLQAQHHPVSWARGREG